MKRKTNAFFHFSFLVILVHFLLFITCSFAGTEETIEQISSRIRTPKEVAAWIFNHFDYQWTIPDTEHSIQETLESKRGDCEDFANLASAILARNGINNKVVVLKIKGLSVYHALCVFKCQDGTYSFISNGKLRNTNEISMEKAIKKFYPSCDRILKMADVRIAHR